MVHYFVEQLINQGEILSYLLFIELAVEISLANTNKIIKKLYD